MTRPSFVPTRAQRAPGASIRVLVASALIALCTTLAACGGTGQYALGLTQENLVGTWYATSANGTELELLDDGTFQAESWPDVLNCTGETPFELGELADSPLVDVTGTWTFDEGDPTVNGGYFIPATLNLHFDEGCDDPSALAGAYFTRDIQGTVTMCFGNTDPDNFGPRTSYAMRREPSPGNPTRQTCTP